MKVLYVSGPNDYAALSFEREFKGRKINDIIDEYFDENITSVRFIEAEDDPDYFEMELFEFSDIDPDFIKFIRNNIEDYDMAKHSTFYIETDIL